MSIFHSIVLFLFLSLSPQSSSKNNSNSPESQELTGTVTGKIELHATVQPSRMDRGARYRNSSPMKGMGEPAAAPNELENVILYLEGKGLDEKQLHQNARTKMDQKDAAFIPHVVAIQKGSIVEFINQDATYHNVFSLSPVRKFNIGRRPTGEAVPIQFGNSGVVQIFCDIHSHMTAFIVVVDHSFFTKADGNGAFSIDRIPPGSYTVKVWHERYTAPEKRVTITGGGTAVLNFVLN